MLLIMTVNSKYMDEKGYDIALLGPTTLRRRRARGEDTNVCMMENSSAGGYMEIELD